MTPTTELVCFDIAVVKDGFTPHFIDYFLRVLHKRFPSAQYAHSGVQNACARGNVHVLDYQYDPLTKIVPDQDDDFTISVREFDSFDALSAHLQDIPLESADRVFAILPRQERSSGSSSGGTPHNKYHWAFPRNTDSNHPVVIHPDLLGSDQCPELNVLQGIEIASAVWRNEEAYIVTGLPEGELPDVAMPYIDASGHRCNRSSKRNFRIKDTLEKLPGLIQHWIRTKREKVRGIGWSWFDEGVAGKRGYPWGHYWLRPRDCSK